VLAGMRSAKGRGASKHRHDGGRGTSITSLLTECRPAAPKPESQNHCGCRAPYLGYLGIWRKTSSGCKELIFLGLWDGSS